MDQEESVYVQPDPEQFAAIVNAIGARGGVFTKDLDEDGGITIRGRVGEREVFVWRLPPVTVASLRQQNPLDS